MARILLLLAFYFLAATANEYEGEGEGGGKGRGGEMFLLQDSKQVLKTKAGEMRVMRGFGGRGVVNPMHIGFISMEPKSLFIPQYIDSDLILFIRRGEAKIGWIYKDELVEKKLKIGDVYRIPAGYTFYMVNIAKGQRLQIVCSIDTSESLGLGAFQSFFIGGGSHPKSVLAGFDPRTLKSAFNVSSSELDEILTRQQKGPIIYITGADEPSKWASIMQLKQKERLEQVKSMEDEDEEESTWTWRKLLKSVVGKEKNMKGGKRTVQLPDSYNIYDRKPNYKNNYGWSIAVDENDYYPLSHSGIGVYLVNLTAGSMMAPHVNPTAIEYGIVLSGSGSIQVVFPNGTSAMNAEVKEGDVFWVPRYFPFCQIASRTGPMEFFGFTTSARKNRPQFLAGESSVLQSMSGPELATAFGVSEERFRHFVEAQRESVILPSAPKKKMTTEEPVAPLIRSFGSLI
ncbi:hypothetical protein HHK36_018255 [Tetracentron sinense]|uniref:Cupin type-1 domain-containing protein n=1 Tax=Tetracentron sinense TaxID=13715 RepID=A0A835DB35_TETSI|nr:hypothetical protein HHK36_018255 [Tetracentron sinense]